MTNKTKNADNNTIYIASLLLIIFVLSILCGAFPVAISHIIESFSLDEAKGGLLNSAFSFGGTILLIISLTFLQSRFSKPALIAGGIMLACISVILFTFAQNYTQLLIMFLFYGIGFASIDVYANAFIPNIAKQNSLLILGLLHGIYGIGSIFTPFLIEALLRIYSWQEVYLFICLLMLAATLPFILLSMKNKQRLNIKAESKIKFTDMIEFFKTKRNIFLVLGCAFYGGSQLGFNIWIFRYVDKVLLSAEFAPIALCTYWICCTLSRFISPHIKINQLKLVMYGNLLSAFILIAGVLTGSAFVMCLVSGAIGLLSGMSLPIFYDISSKWYPQYTSLPISTIGIIMSLARMLASASTGFIAAAVSLSFGLAFVSVFSFISGLCCLPILKYAKQV